jgi:hypothetical protein
MLPPGAGPAAGEWVRGVRTDGKELRGHRAALAGLSATPSMMRASSTCSALHRRRPLMHSHLPLDACPQEVMASASAQQALLLQRAADLGLTTHSLMGQLVHGPSAGRATSSSVPGTPKPPPQLPVSLPRSPRLLALQGCSRPPSGSQASRPHTPASPHGSSPLARGLSSTQEALTAPDAGGLQPRCGWPRHACWYSLVHAMLKLRSFCVGRHSAPAYRTVDPPPVPLPAGASLDATGSTAATTEDIAEEPATPTEAAPSQRQSQLQLQQAQHRQPSHHQPHHHRGRQGMLKVHHDILASGHEVHRQMATVLGVLGNQAHDWREQSSSRLEVRPGGGARGFDRAARMQACGQCMYAWCVCGLLPMVGYNIMAHPPCMPLNATATSPQPQAPATHH